MFLKINIGTVSWNENNRERVYEKRAVLKNTKINYKMSLYKKYTMF